MPTFGEFVGAQRLGPDGVNLLDQLHVVEQRDESDEVGEGHLLSSVASCHLHKNITCSHDTNEKALRERWCTPQTLTNAYKRSQMLTNACSSQK